MPSENQNDDRPSGSSIGDGIASEFNREDGERQKYQKERDAKEDAYKDAQSRIEAGQLATNRRIAVYTLILTIVSGFGLVVSFLSSQAAKSAADIALATNRPMLKLKLALRNTGFELQKDGSIRVSVIPEIENVGNGLPIRTDLSVFLDVPDTVVMENDQSGPLRSGAIADGLRNNCMNSETSERSMIPFITIFPGDHEELLPEGETVDFDIIKKRGRMVEGRYQFVVIVYGCLTYSYPDKTSIHRTGIAYQLQLARYGLLTSGTEYKGSDLLLEHFRFHSDFAN